MVRGGQLRSCTVPVTMDTFRHCYPRVSDRAASNTEACCTKGAPLRKVTSLLLRFIGVPERLESPDWWTYFGSFGDDIFGDEDTDDA